MKLSLNKYRLNDPDINNIIHESLAREHDRKAIRVRIKLNHRKIKNKELA